MMRLLLSICMLFLLHQAVWAQVVLSENFETTAAGSLPSGWTPSNTGLSNWVVQGSPPNRTVTSRTTGGNTGETARLSSVTFATVSGDNYVVSFLLSEATRVSLSAGRVGGAGQSINVTTLGTKSFSFTANAATAAIFFVATATANGNVQLTLDNVVVERKVPELDFRGWPSAALMCALVLLLAERRKPFRAL